MSRYPIFLNIFRKPADDHKAHLLFQFSCRKIVEEEKWSGSADSNIIYTMIHQALPNRIISFSFKGDDELCSYTIHTADQNRFLHRPKISGEKRSEEHTSELQSRGHLVCRLLLEKKKIK